MIFDIMQAMISCANFIIRSERTTAVKYLPLRAVYVILHIRRSTEGPKLSIDFEWVATMAD